MLYYESPKMNMNPEGQTRKVFQKILSDSYLQYFSENFICNISQNVRKKLWRRQSTHGGERMKEVKK